VWHVADCTSFTQGLVLKDKRPSLLFVALETCLIPSEQHCSSGGPHIASMHIVAISAEHSSFGHGMMMLEHKLTFNLEVAGKAGRFSICADNPALVGWVINM